jgi:hypothetical protein
MLSGAISTKCADQACARFEASHFIGPTSAAVFAILALPTLRERRVGGCDNSIEAILAFSSS